MSPRTIAARQALPQPAQPQPRPRWNTRAGDCRHACPAGNPCTCTDHAHAWRICSNPRCWCHDAQRYQGKAAHPDPTATMQEER